jgi:general stress protein 26
MELTDQTGHGDFTETEYYCLMKAASEGKREEALSFLVNHDTGVLATLSRANETHARMVYYTCDDAFNIYFITLKNTRKVSDLASNEQAAFVVSEMEVPRTIQIEGVVEDLTSSAVVDPLLTDFVHRLMSHDKYGIPLSHFDASELKFYRLTPTWVRWGDFTFGEGTDKVLTEIDTAEPPQERD